MQSVPGGLQLSVETEAPFVVEPGDLVHAETRSDAEVYGHKVMQGWRLGILRPVPEEIAAHLPGRTVYGGIVDRLGLARTMVIAGAISASLLTLGYFAPRWLAPAVPQSWEDQVGAALVGDVDRNACRGEEGQAALDKLARRLSPAAARYKVRVVDVPMMNAVALPGRNILLFKPLVHEALGPDEVAGILGHEIAHIEKRHVTEAMIRHYGISMLMIAFGGTTGANIETVAAAGYSRRAEREADSEAIASLNRANISPAATADFFKRLSEMERGPAFMTETLGYLSSHPLSSERRQQFEAAAKRGREYEPALDDMEWQALRDICGFKR